MDNALITVLSLSVSGSILTLVLFGLKPLLKNRISKAFSYYIWLLVLLRLVLPISAPLNITGMLFGINQTVTDNAQERQTDSPSVDNEVSEKVGELDGDLIDQVDPQDIVSEPQNKEAADTHTATDAVSSFQLWDFIKNNLIWIWLAGAVVCIGWFISAYIYFSRQIRRSSVTPHPDDTEYFRKLRGDMNIGLVCSGYASTPMLIGVFRPKIILPKFTYVQKGMGEELKNILIHELTHYRRKDVLYKWLAVLVTSLHWFNPLMLLVRKEIGRACELACDEAVIGGMSAEEKQAYGNTLLELSANRKIPVGILATTLCEGKEQLKERLVSIMKYKKQSTWAIALTLLITLLLAGCAAGLGTVNSSGKITPSEENTLSGSAYSRKMDGEILNWNGNGCGYRLDSDGSVICFYNNGMVTGKAPVTLSTAAEFEEGPRSDNTGFFISNEKTAIAYCGENDLEPITAIISDDMGQTWETTNIDFDGAASWINIGFLNMDDGWLILCTYHGSGSEDHFIYKTSDGGKSWTFVESNIDDFYSRMLSGSGFVSDQVGFLCFRYETEFQPAVCITRDGGTTWSKLFIELPEEYDEYYKTAFSPIYDGEKIIMPVFLSDYDNDIEKTIYLTSEDYGDTWQLDGMTLTISTGTEEQEDEDNGITQSPRTSVTGILAEPEKSFSVISVICGDDFTDALSPEDEQEVLQILSTMEAEEVLTPYHYEAQESDPMFTLLLTYDDNSGIGETIYSNETGSYFYRRTDTVGDNGDSGYVGGFSETLNTILSAYIPPEVSAGYVSDEFLSEYSMPINEYIEFEEEGYQKIIIEPTTTIKDFKYIEVGFDEVDSHIVYFEKEVLYSLDELSPEKPFVVTWMDWGLIPHRGISFVDENNETRYFYITTSGRDGRLLLVEF